jgi:hypothetical protein
MNAVHRFFKRREHRHIIKLDDMATGKRKYCVAITGWKWKCILCGREICEYNQSAMELMDEGKKSAEIFEWQNDRCKKESEQ